MIRRLTRFARREPLTALLLAVLLGVLALHLVWYIHPSDVASAADFDARIRQGQPTIVEFYSNL